MNNATHQEKKKNEETRKGKREVGKRERKATDFKNAACCLSAVVQGAAMQKNGLCEGSARGSWDPRESQQPFRPNPNGVGDRTTTLKRLLIGTPRTQGYAIIYWSKLQRSFTNSDTVSTLRSLQCINGR